MSNLTYLEKQKFEKLFGMESGYVLDFSNRTFQNFVSEILDIDIYDTKYAEYGDSKARRLRKFWDSENNYFVEKLLTALLQYWNEEIHDNYKKESDYKTYESCIKAIDRLKGNLPSIHLEDIKKIDDTKDTVLLLKDIHNQINRNEPELALDRLHTYIVKYIRSICNKRGIEYTKEETLHSCFGKYIKHLKKIGGIESKMTENILKTSISILDSFNSVRNDKSFAHDNKILNYQESLLIFKNISSFIAFIDYIEKLKNQDYKEIDEDFSF